MADFDENTMLNTAIERLKETTGYNIELTYNLNRRDNLKDGEPGMIVCENTYKYTFIVKKWINNAVIGLIRNEIGDNYPNVILVADYVNKIAAEKLKEMGIQFIDLAGNAFLKRDGLFIYINGRKNATELNNKQETVRLYTTTGLKLIFTLLCADNVIDKPYREIAEIADVANGTVGWVMNDLIKLGYLVKKDEKRHLLNKEELLKKWVEHYPLKLKNKLLVRKYRVQDNNLNNINNLKYDGVYTGGEAAAAKITNYLIPRYYTFYVQGNTNRLVIENKMVQDPKGEIELVQKFWNFKDTNDMEGIVPDILIYADLLATGEGRNIETAGMIYEQRIKRNLR